MQSCELRDARLEEERGTAGRDEAGAFSGGDVVQPVLGRRAGFEASELL